MKITIIIGIVVVVLLTIIAITIAIFTPISFIQKLQNKSWSVRDFPSKKVNFQINESQKEITVIGLEDAFNEKTFTYTLLNNKLVSSASTSGVTGTGSTLDITLQNNNLLLVYTGETQVSIELI